MKLKWEKNNPKIDCLSRLSLFSVVTEPVTSSILPTTARDYHTEASFALARPTDKATIEYLIHIGSVLSGGMVNEEARADEALEKTELLDSIMTTLDMTEAELTGNIKRSILSTARQIIGVKYPGESVVYADVKKEHIRAIAGYSFYLRLAINFLFSCFQNTAG